MGKYKPLISAATPVAPVIRIALAALISSSILAAAVPDTSLTFDWYPQLSPSFTLHKLTHWANAWFPVIAASTFPSSSGYLTIHSPLRCSIHTFPPCFEYIIRPSVLISSVGLYNPLILLEFLPVAPLINTGTGALFSAAISSSAAAARAAASWAAAAA